MQSLPRFYRYVQPLGFAFLLLFLSLKNYPWATVLFWLGLVLSLLGTLTEIWIFRHTKISKRTQTNFVFSFGIGVKLLLILSIGLHIYEVKNSVFILLGSLILAFAWGLLSLFVKPEIASNDDILDIK